MNSHYKNQYDNLLHKIKIYEQQIHLEEPFVTDYKSKHRLELKTMKLNKMYKQLGELHENYSKRTY